MTKKNGIALKTFLFTSGLITVIVAISLGILYFVLPNYYLNTKNRLLQQSADAFEHSLKKAGAKDECEKLISEFSLTTNSFVMSYDNKNLIIPDLSSPFILMGDSKRFRIIVGTYGDPKEEKDKKYVFTTPDNGNVMIQSKSKDNIVITKIIDNDFIDHVIITGTLQPIDEAKSVIISLMPYLLLVDILIALIAAYFYSRRITKPILAISRAASEMQKLTPDILSNVKSNDELGDLSKNLDSMYLSLCENIKSLQHEMETVNKLEQSKTDFMRAASHELKTPITALNGIVEGMIDNVGKYKDREKYLEQSKNLIDKLGALVNEILVASSLEKAENSLNYEMINISDVIVKACEEYAVLADEKQLEISIRKEDALFTTDRKLFSNALSNILSNAVKYSHNGGKINIVLKTDDNDAFLSIENQCDNIDEEELTKLFEPFYTLNYSRDKRKSGTGLGLYIVKRILERLQIPYCLENSPLGLKFTMFFRRSA